MGSGSFEPAMEAAVNAAAQASADMWLELERRFSSLGIGQEFIGVFTMKALSYMVVLSAKTVGERADSELVLKYMREAQSYIEGLAADQLSIGSNVFTPGSRTPSA